MADNKINTAQALLAHIALKTEPLALFGAQINVRQWTASDRIKYLDYISQDKDENDTLRLLRSQANIVALSLVDDNGQPFFPVKWVDKKPVFDDEESVDLFVQNRLEETSAAFITVSAFNGVMFQGQADEEEQTVKN